MLGRNVILGGKGNEILSESEYILLSLKILFRHKFCAFTFISMACCSYCNMHMQTDNVKITAKLTLKFLITARLSIQAFI